MMPNNNMLFDQYPAEITPWPEGVPKQRVRAVGFESGLVVLWDPGGKEVARRDIMAESGQTATATHAAGHDVVRAAGCACGSRRLRSMKVTAPVRPEGKGPVSEVVKPQLGSLMTEPLSPESEETGDPVESPA